MFDLVRNIDSKSGTDADDYLNASIYETLALLQTQFTLILKDFLQLKNANPKVKDSAVNQLINLVDVIGRCYTTETRQENKVLDPEEHNYRCMLLKSFTNLCLFLLNNDLVFEDKVAIYDALTKTTEKTNLMFENVVPSHFA